ncbi:MAG: hypothetical protein ABIQ17_04405 [Candidatus Limnocylindrales bacterium]
MYFYELHEGDADLFYDVLLSRDEEMGADEFFTIVQTLRRQLQDSFASDTLVEAIAEELERHYGFVFISDDRLTAAVNVSKIEDDNFLADLDGGADDEDGEDDEPEQIEVIGDADYRGVYAQFDPDAGNQN